MKIKTITKTIKKGKDRLKKSNPLRTPSTYLEAQKDAKKALGAAYKGLFLLGAIASIMFTYTEGKKMLSHFIGDTCATMGALAFSAFIFYLIDMTLSKVSPLAFMSLLHKNHSTRRGVALLGLCMGLAFLSMKFSYNGASSPMELAFSYKKGKDVDLVALREEASEEKERLKAEYLPIIQSAKLQDAQKLSALKQDSAKLVSECIARNARYKYSEETANKYLQRAIEDGADKVATYSPTAPTQQQKLLNKLDDIDYEFEEYEKKLTAQKKEKDVDYAQAVAKGSIMTEWLGVGSTLLGVIVCCVFIVLQMPENQAQAKPQAGSKQSASKAQADNKDLRRSLKNKAYSSLRRIRDKEGDVHTNVQNVITVYEEIQRQLGHDELEAFLKQTEANGTYPIFKPQDLSNLLNQI